VIGGLKDPGLVPIDSTFENSLKNVKGEDKRMFIKFEEDG
jgi:hypothetical protein